MITSTTHNHDHKDSKDSKEMIVPLHQRTPQQLCSCIKQWVLGDVNYLNSISETQRKFKQRELHGQMICALPMDSIKVIMKKDLLSFMTPKTFDIIMTHCKEWKDDAKRQTIDDLKSKSAEQIAAILLNYPLSRVVCRIMGDHIDGQRFIQSMIASNEDIIAEETGWSEDDVYQIQSMLFRHHTFTQSQFEQNMDDILSQEYRTKLSKDIIERIKWVMSQHNVEKIHYRIKNAMSIAPFADSIMDMVDEWTQTVYKQNPKAKDENELIFTHIYHAIAQCFVFSIKNEDDLLRELQHWICNNCGNCNVNSSINSSFTTDVTVCTLCGLHQIDQIILKLRHHKHTKRDDALKCKYYDRHYNIIRNEFIGLRHLFALIVYVDMTAFCTHFRRTYRKLSSQKNEDVTGRHLELYYYARALYESIEFFGEYMSEDLKVYHGLDHVLLFSKFTTYFNSPISTTRDLIIANQFSQGRGIILTLEAATGYLSGKHEKAKYVSVSWLSSYPNEDEYLFYGKYVKFKICNIYNVEHGASKGHSEALLLLNKFQKIVNNHDVGWKKGNVWIKSLAEWINEKKKNVIDANCVDMFGKNLFNYFCQDQTKIVINNFVQLPPLLLVALFADKAAISFTEITKVFPQMQVIMLSELDIEPMTASVERYMLSLLQYVKTASNSSGRNLEKIVFKSKVQNDGKQNPTLANKVNKYLKAFRRNGWETGYELSPENAHNLSFTIHKTLSLHPRNVIIADAFNKPANIDHSAKYSPKQGQAPKYFMEVTSVDEDIFHLNVVADAEKDWSRKLFIKDMNHLENTGMVIIRKGQISEGINMEIGAADTYRFAIYATVESEEVISSAFQLELTVLKDEKEMPPHNTQYRPKCVDSATVFQVKDSESKRINVYWSIPPKSFGNVSYRIVINEHHAAMISSLPYSVPFSSIALMNPFRVVTVTETEWNIYESNPSDPISIMHCGDVLSSIEDDYNNPQKAQYNYNYVQDRTPQQAQYNYNYDHDNDSNQAQWARNDDILYNSDDPLRYLTQNKPSTRVKRSNKSSHGGQPKVSRKIKIIKSKGKAKTKEIDSKPSPVPQQMTLNSKQRRDMAINRSKRALATWNLYVDRYEIIAKRYLTQIAE
eukprot:464799_1